VNELRTNSGLRRTAAVLILGTLVLGGSIATAAAFNGRGSSGGEDPASPAPSTPVVTPEPVISPEPVVTPEPVISPEPIETPELVGGDVDVPGPDGPPDAPEPTNEPGDVPTVIDLETADGHDVTVDLSEIVDLLDGAESGHPAEGMSVEPYTLINASYSMLHTYV
jgi:hypothetical protein